jgi:dolichyl-phosphate-mannose--protein O-mannosyl transferase
MWIPIAIFGMSPFTYRLMGNIAGIIMILVMYIIGKDLFKHDKYGLFAAIIMAADGMHFTQTRIGTVDSFLALFSIMAFMFFIKYLKVTDDNEQKKRYIMLALSGLCWGCAVSTKWNTAFVGIGLAVLFFIDYFKNKKMIIDNKFNHKPITMGFASFVAIPLVVSLASYLPIYWNPNEVASYDVIDEDGQKSQVVVSPNSIWGFLQYQYSMYQYHAHLGPEDNPDYYEHPFASKWYTWPISYKPMWFYFKDYEGGTMRSTIATMANPAIWWLSCVTFVYTIVYTIIKRDKTGLILLLMIAATWLPYARITRDMYIYHYFITLPYMMLTIVYCTSSLINWKDKFNKLIPILSAVFILFFIYFYPIYSGKIVSMKYNESTKFLTSWTY